MVSVTLASYAPQDEGIWVNQARSWNAVLHFASQRGAAILKRSAWFWTQSKSLPLKLFPILIP